MLMLMLMLFGWPVLWAAFGWTQLQLSNYASIESMVYRGVSREEAIKNHASVMSGGDDVLLFCMLWPICTAVFVIFVLNTIVNTLSQ